MTVDKIPQHFRLQEQIYFNLLNLIDFNIRM